VLADLCQQTNYGILALEYNNAFLAPLEIAGERVLDVTTAYRSGYRDRVDRKEKFQLNFDMEPVQALEPPAAIDFLRKFYARFDGQYFLGLDEGCYGS